MCNFPIKKDKKRKTGWESKQPKGVNFILEAVTVWPRERNISIVVDNDAPFRDYRYLYISIHKYMFVFTYVSINLLIFTFINIKFKIHIFYMTKYWP